MKERFWFFTSMFLVAFQIFIALPIAVWLHNQFNFSAAFSDSITVFGLLLIAITCILLLLALITPRNIQKHLFPVFVFTSLLLYLQQYLLIWDYGILDGRSIDFSVNKYLGLIDTGLWLIGAAILIALRKKISHHTKTILSFSILLTGIAAITTVISHDFSDKVATGSVNEAEKFTYSKDKNILLFLLDGFQSDLFWEMINQDSNIKSELTGFTYYSNTSGVFAKTYPTIPLLLTGKRYQKQQSFQDFLTLTYQDSILAELKSDGWNVGLYPHVKSTIILDETIMSNYHEHSQWPEKIDNYLQALDLSLFQSVPHSLKHHIYNEGDFVTRRYLSDFAHRFDDLFPSRTLVKLPHSQPHQGLSFRENLRTSGTDSSPKPTYRFYHLFMPHKPFLLNRDLEFSGYGDDFSAYQDYAYASIKLMISYLKELKKLGVYDSSSIIIAADHGAGEYTNKKYLPGERRYVPVLKNGEAIASGKPLLVVKNYLEDGPLKVSSKPVSLLDVAPTIANFAGIKPKKMEGEFIDDIAEDQQRDRTYFHYNFSGWDSKFLNDFDVYKIEGDVYDENAWTLTGKLSAQQKMKNRKTYVLGGTIRFGSDIKTDADYMNAFLSEAEYEHRFSSVVAVDGQIHVSFSLNSPVRGNEFLLLETELSSTNETLNVELELNNKSLDSFEVDKKQVQINFFSSKDFALENKVNLRLYVSDHTGKDGKLMFSKLKLQKASMSELTNDSIIHFSENLDKFFIKGMWYGESWGRWTKNVESSMRFYTSEGFCKDRYMLISINRFYSGVNPESFEVFLNDSKLDLVKTDKNHGGKEYYFDCSSYDSLHTGVASLKFRTDGVGIPMLRGTNDDSRSLGVGLISLKLIEKEAKPTP